MANRIIKKKSIDERGNEKHAYEWIKDYLRLEGEKRFGEIKQYLAEHDIRYASDKGLDLALKSLMYNDSIGKRNAQDRFSPYPVYYIKKNVLNRVNAVAQLFQHNVNLEANYFPKLPKQNLESDDKYLVRNLIHTYGIYVLFVMMKSWRFTSDKNSDSDNFDIRLTWQRKTIPNGYESFCLEDGITKLVEPGSTVANIEESYQINVDKKKWNKLSEIEELLKKMYPNHMEFFEKLLAKSIEEQTTHKQLMKIPKQRVKKNHTVKKNTKNSKKI